MWNYVHTGLENATEYVVSDKSEGGAGRWLLEEIRLLSPKLNLS